MAKKALPPLSFSRNVSSSERESTNTESMDRAEFQEAFHGKENSVNKHLRTAAQNQEPRKIWSLGKFQVSCSRVFGAESPRNGRTVQNIWIKRKTCCDNRQRVHGIEKGWRQAGQNIKQPIRIIEVTISLTARWGQLSSYMYSGR